jgi:hypothetical protein
MRLTTALLATAAALTGTSGAFAADLPTTKAAPVEYVRVCSVHGAGFWYIPGTDTCIKLGGRVRADYIYASPANSWSTAKAGSSGIIVDPGTFTYGRNIDASGFEANGRLNVDVRTSTEWGTLRAFFRYDLYRDSGPFAGTTSALYTPNAASANTPGLYYSNPFGAPTSDVGGLDLAYIQFAGFTAGRIQSFFDFYANQWNFTKLAGSDRKTQAFAYTASFGGGFSATLSVEDSAESKRNSTYAYPLAFAAVYNGTTYYSPWYGSGTINYGGTRMPDVVGNLRYDGSWGSAQLSGAVHQTTFSEINKTSYGPFKCATVDGLCPVDSINDAKYGFAVQAGLKINLPMLAKGDQLWLQAAYAAGAISYLSPRFTTFGDAIGVLPDQWVFPVINPTTRQFTGAYSIEQTKGYALTATMLHYWTPTIRQAVFGSYLKIDNPTGAYVAPSVISTPIYGDLGAPDVTVWQVGSNIVWSPVTGLDIGPEIMYVHVDAGNRPLYNVAYQNASYWVTSGNQDRWIGRFRVERNF